MPVICESWLFATGVSDRYVRNFFLRIAKRAPISSWGHMDGGSRAGENGRRYGYR
jgi:hypothetical protein